MFYFKIILKRGEFICNHLFFLSRIYQFKRFTYFISPHEDYSSYDLLNWQWNLSEPEVNTLRRIRAIMKKLQTYTFFLPPCIKGNDPIFQKRIAKPSKNQF